MPRNPDRPKRVYTFRNTTAEERSAISAAAAHARWAKITDRPGATLAARGVARARYYAEADAQGVTDPELREKMARSAMLAEMARLRVMALRKARERSAAAAADAAA